MGEQETSGRTRTGTTPALSLDLPIGGTVYAVGLGFTQGLGSSMRLTDPVQIDL